MRQRLIWLFLVTALTYSARGAELFFDFAAPGTNSAAFRFRSTVAGTGPQGEWKVLYDDVPPLLAPLSDKAPAIAKRPVVAQLNADATDERFPMFVYEDESFSDFSLTTRFKLVSGAQEQMAGIAFHIKDEKNFYVIRASGLGTNLAFYKVINGQRQQFIRADVAIAQNTWHELKIESYGNKIECRLNGPQVLPVLVDELPRIPSGKIAFWTKSDAVSYFTDTRLTYVPVEIPARVLVRELVKKYPRLRGLKVYTPNAAGEPEIVASKDEAEHGTLGGTYEKDCLNTGKIFYGHDKPAKIVSVILPLRDRNGDALAAVRVMMEAGAGQTEQNAISRALPIVKEMQARVLLMTDFARSSRTAKN